MPNVPPILADANRSLNSANRELETFAYSVSHDLRAPLRAIDGYSHILQEDYGDKLDAEALRLIQAIRDGVTKMARLIDDVLAFSREARSEMSASDIDMTGLVQATLNGLAPAMTDRAIEVKVAPLPRTRGDREMMQRVWLNLLDNAIKFTGHKEHALIEVGSYPRPLSRHRRARTPWPLSRHGRAWPGHPRLCQSDMTINRSLWARPRRREIPSTS